MHFQSVGLVVGAIVTGIAWCQSTASLPACATSCVASAIPSSCNLDPACICQSSSFLDAVSCCTIAACSPSDQVLVIAYANSICNPVGVTNIPTTCNNSSTIASSVDSATGTIASTIASQISTEAASTLTIEQTIGSATFIYATITYPTGVSLAAEVTTFYSTYTSGGQAITTAVFTTEILFVPGEGGPSTVSSAGASSILTSSTPNASSTASPVTPPTPPSHTGAIVGGVVGGIVAIVLVASVAFLLARRRKRASGAAAKDTTPEVDTGPHLGKENTAELGGYSSLHKENPEVVSKERHAELDAGGKMWATQPWAEQPVAVDHNGPPAELAQEPHSALSRPMGQSAELATATNPVSHHTATHSTGLASTPHSPAGHTGHPTGPGARQGATEMDGRGRPPELEGRILYPENEMDEGSGGHGPRQLVSFKSSADVYRTQWVH